VIKCDRDLHYLSDLLDLLLSKSPIR